MKTTCKEPLYATDFKIIEQSESCTVYEMTEGSNTGIITSYQVFPGIRLTYNDFHVGKCPNHVFLSRDIVEINHCREGRFECEFIDGMYTYLSEGDLAVNTIINNQVVNATFPLEHYHGVSIIIDLKEAATMISTILADISIDLYSLRNKLCANNRCFIIRATDSIQHIFSELYTIPDSVKQGYFKLKVLELLLFLSVIDAAEQYEQRPYFQKNQVNKIKEIKGFLTDNISRHITLETLSTRYDIPLSAMNSCFKAVYGMPINTYMRMYRMQAAAAMLITSSDSITVIAGNVGYENSSKFASAFRAVMNISPSDYRKSR
ncbi:MAG: AraC family transcriptional regulator [Negativicutes bacterium]|nr:AraC family transcriptional regulator [Negativicutes bacterium]